MFYSILLYHIITYHIIIICSIVMNHTTCNKANTFDLNIDNYSLTELEDMIGLSSQTPYTKSMIDNQCGVLTDKIVNDHSVQSHVREKTLLFINDVKKVLYSSSSSSSSSSSIQQIHGGYLLAEKKMSGTGGTLSGTSSDGASTFLIDKPAGAYTQSFPSEYYSGTINPLNKRILKQHLSIDTRFRDNYYQSSSTHFHFDLPTKFSNVVSMQLSAFEFPSTAYCISEKAGNTFFWVSSIVHNSIDGAVLFSEKARINVPDGNYTPTSLIDYLNHFVSTSTTFTTTIHLKNIKFALNISVDKSGSGQTIIRMPTSYPVDDIEFIVDFQMDKHGNPDTFTQLPLKLGWILGFREGMYLNNLNYVSEGIANTNGSLYMYLVVDDYNNNVNNGFFSAFNSSVLNKNILARISLTDGAFNNITQNNLSLITNPRVYFGPVDIQKMNIQLLDEYGRIIDLNHMDYSFCLTLQTVYDL